MGTLLNFARWLLGKTAAAGFILVTIDRTLQLFRVIAEKYISLPLHRANASHLKHQPLYHQRAALAIAGH